MPEISKVGLIGSGVAPIDTSGAANQLLETVRRKRAEQERMQLELLRQQEQQARQRERSTYDSGSSYGGKPPSKSEVMNARVDSAVGYLYKSMASGGVNMDDFVASDDRIDKARQLDPYLRKLLEGTSAQSLTPKERAFFNSQYLNRVRAAMLSDNLAPPVSDSVYSPPTPAPNKLAQQAAKAKKPKVEEDSTWDTIGNTLGALGTKIVSGFGDVTGFGASTIKKTDLNNRISNELMKRDKEFKQTMNSRRSNSAATVELYALERAKRNNPAAYKQAVLAAMKGQKAEGPGIAESALSWVSEKANTLANSMRDNGALTENYKNQERKVGAALDEGRFGDAVDNFFRADTALPMTAGFIGEIIGSGGTVGGGVKVAAMAGRGAAKLAGAAAAKGGAKALAGGLTKAGTKAAVGGIERAAVAGASNFGAAASQAEGTARQVYDNVKALPMDVITESPAYQKAKAMLPNNASHEDVLELTARTQADMSRTLGLGAGLIGMRIGGLSESVLLGPAGVLKKLAAGKARSTALGSFVKNVGKEALGEAIEEGSQAALTSAMPTGRLSDLNVDSTMSTAAFAAILGGAIGGMVHGTGAIADARKGGSSLSEADVAKALDADEALNEALARDIERKAARGDAESQDLIANAAEYHDSISALVDAQDATMSAIANDQTNTLNAPAHALSAKVQMDKTFDGALDGNNATSASAIALMSHERAGDVSGLNVPELEVLTRSNRLDAAGFDSGPTSAVANLDPDTAASVISDALRQRFSDLNAPLRTAGNSGEAYEARVGALVEGLQRSGLSTGNVVEISRQLVDNGFGGNMKSNYQILKGIENATPQLAPEVAAVRQYLTDREDVRLAQLKLKNVTSSPAATAVQQRELRAEALLEGRRVLDAQDVVVFPKTAPLNTDNYDRILEQLEGGKEQGIHFTTLTGKAEIARSKGVSAFDYARKRQELNKRRDAGVTRVFNTGTEIDGGIANSAVGLFQKADFKADNALILKQLANTATEGYTGDKGNILHRLGANTYDSLMKARVLFTGQLSTLRAKYIVPTLQLEERAIAENPDLDATAVRNALTKYTLLRNVDDRARQKFTNRQHLLTPEAKLRAAEIDDKIANTDGQGTYLYSKLEELYQDKNNYIDPEAATSHLEMGIDVTTELDAQQGAPMTVTPAEAQQLMVTIERMLGKEVVQEYSGLVIDGHKAALAQRIASGHVDQRTARIIAARPNENYVPFKRVNSRTGIGTDADSETLSYRNRKYMRYQGPEVVDNPLRSSTGVLEDHLMGSTMSSLEQPVISSLVQLGKILNERGIDSIIEVRDAAPPVYDVESGQYVYPDLPSVDQANVLYYRSADNNNKVVVIKDDRVSRAVNSIWGDPERGQLAAEQTRGQRAAKVTLQGLKTATRMVLRAKLITPDYLFLTAPSRDFRENINESLRKNGFKAVGEASWIQAQHLLRNSTDVAKFLWAKPENAADAKENLRKKLKEQPDNKSLQYFLEMLDEGAIMTFGQEITKGTNVDGLSPNPRTDGEAGRIRKAFGRAVDGLDHILHNIETVQTFSDSLARITTYAAAREAGMEKGAAAAAARQVLNFAQQPDLGDGKADYLSLVFPFYRSGLIGASKATRSIWKDERPPTITEQLPDGTVVSRVDPSQIYDNLALRPIVTNMLVSSMTAGALVALATADGGDGKDADGRPSGAAGLDVNQLITALPLLYSYDSESGDVDVTGAGSAYGFAPFMGALATGAALASTGLYDKSDIVDTLTNQLVRNFSPVGDVGLAEMFGGSHASWMRSTFNNLMPVLVKPISEVMVNRDSIGRPVFDEDSATRGQLFAAQDTHTGGRMVTRGDPRVYDFIPGVGSETTRHLLEGYLGGFFSVVEELGTAVFSRLNGDGVASSLEKENYQTIPGRTAVTNRYYQQKQFGKLMDRVYVPTAEHIKELKEADGTEADFKRTGSNERAWQRNNKDTYAVFRRLNTYFHAKSKLDEKIMAEQDGSNRAVKLDALMEQRHDLLSALVSGIEEDYPDVM